MAGAPEENTNALKWSLDDALELYSKAFSISNKQQVYFVGNDERMGFEYDFIGELIDALREDYKDTDKRIYRKLLSTHLPSRYEELKEQWEELKSKMEVNCYSNTKKGIINTAVGIINLKSNHDWKDKISNEHTIKTEQPLFGDE